MVTQSLRPTINLTGLRTRWSKQPERLRSLTWDDLKELAGTKKIQVINDFRRHGITLQVRLLTAGLPKRLTPEQLEEVRAAGGLAFAVPNEQSWLAPEAGDDYDDQVLLLTPEWQAVSALVGFWLRDNSFRHPLLGAAFTDERYVERKRPDGQSDWKLDLVRVPRVTLLEFRGPGDVPGGGAAAGLVLPTFVRPARPVPAGASFDFTEESDDAGMFDLPDPDREAEREAAALAALEPSDAEIAQAAIGRRKGG